MGGICTSTGPLERIARLQPLTDLSAAVLPDVLGSPEVRFAAVGTYPELVARFRSRWQRPLSSVEDRTKAIRLHVDELLANVGMLHERGVPIVLGTSTSYWRTSRP